MMISVSTCLEKLFDAFFSQPHPAGTFKVEGLGDNTDGQNASFTRGAGDNRCSTRAGAAAHAGGDEAPCGCGQVVDRSPQSLPQQRPRHRFRAGRRHQDLRQA